MKVSLRIHFSHWVFPFNVMELKSITLQVFLFHSCCLLRTNLANLFILCLPPHCYRVYIKLSKTTHFLLSLSDHSLSTYMLLSEEGDKTSLRLLPIALTLWLLCASLPPCPIGSVWNHFHDSRSYLFKYLQRPWHFVGWLELKPLCQ